MVSGDAFAAGLEARCLLTSKYLTARFDRESRFSMLILNRNRAVRHPSLPVLGCRHYSTCQWQWAVDGPPSLLPAKVLWALLQNREGSAGSEEAAVKQYGPSGQ